MPLSLRDKPPALTGDPGVSVALVEPRIPQNTGNIARLCACTGASLYLVGSLGFRIDDRYLSRAGMDYLDDVPLHRVPDFPDLLAAHPGYEPYFATTKAENSYTDIAYPEKTLLVFGSETHGLPAWVMEEHPGRCIRIPQQAGTRSLNLANSAAIVVYEVIRQRLISS